MNKKFTVFEGKLLDQSEWKEQPENYITDHFVLLGFTCPNDFMKLRVYDFLNLDMVDNNRAEEMIVYLSKYLYPDREEYAESYGSTTTKIIFNWLESHSDPAKVTLKDLICTESMSMEEMLYIFDFLSQSFYHSGEYNSRKYLYGSIQELSYMTDHVNDEKGGMTC